MSESMEFDIVELGSADENGELERGSAIVNALSSMEFDIVVLRSGR